MATLTYPNNFSPNTIISSSQVNANFAAISTLFNTTGFGDANITPGGISHVSLANASVQKDTLNTNVADQTSITGGAGTALSVGALGVTLAMLAAAVANALNPSGTIIAMGGSSVPTGYLECDGSAVSRTTYADLFTAISTKWGIGDGSTTFNLPDARGMFLRGYNHGKASGHFDNDASSRTASGTSGSTGDAVGSYQSNQNKAHTHTVNPQDVGGGTGAGSIAHGSGPNSDTVTTSSNGGTQSQPENVYVMYCIKT